MKNQATDRRIEYAKLSELAPDPKNPKTHDVGAIYKSIGRFGYVEPVVVDERTGRLVAGHGRVQTLRQAKQAGDKPPDGVREQSGEWLVPVLRGWKSRSEKDASAYILASNKTSELGGWDEALLTDVMKSIGDLDGTGFDGDDLDDLLAKTTDIIEDEAPEPPKEATCKHGQVWELGKHVLLVGSCEELHKVAGKKSCKIMVTDPPYGVSYAAKNEFLNAVARGNRIQTEIENDHHSPEEMSALWTTWFNATRPLLADGAAYYVTGPQGGDLLLLLLLLLALRDADYQLKHMLIWAKNNHVLGRCDYHYQHEPILYGWVDGTHHAVEDRSETSLWKIDKPQKSDLHPTMKPVELYARAYRNSSDVGDTCLEPFAGSGTALIAAEQTNRKVIASELDARYADVIIERWQNLTGGKAKRAKG